jgi:hypothetical protein
MLTDTEKTLFRTILELNERRTTYHKDGKNSVSHKFLTFSPEQILLGGVTKRNEVSKTVITCGTDQKSKKGEREREREKI